MRRRSLARRALPWAVILGMFLVWEALCRLFNVPEFVLPLPTQIFDFDIRPNGDGPVSQARGSAAKTS